MALVSGAVAQVSDRQGIGNLELRLRPKTIKRGIPQGFTFQIVNRTKHDVRIPTPTIDCEDTFNGSIWLRLELTPALGMSGTGLGCAADLQDWPPIVERIKKWKIVHPGDAVSLESDREHLFYDDKEPGNYEFSADYVPPYISPSDQNQLRALGIEFPHTPLATAHITFTKRK